MALVFKVAPRPNIGPLLIYCQVPNTHGCELLVFRVEPMGVQNTYIYLHKHEPLAFVNPLELISSSNFCRPSIQ